MRALKLALISFVFLFLVVTAISLFLPSHVRLSKAINIKARRELILNQVSDLRQWRNWYPGFDTLATTALDSSNGRITRMGTPGPTIEVMQANDSSVVTVYSSPGKNAITSGWNLIAYSHTDSLTLQWYMDFTLRWYPWEKFASLMLERSYGPSMEKGLNRLKHQAEAN